MKILKYVSALLLAASLVACGGGGGSAGTTTGGGGSNPDTTVPDTTQTAVLPVITVALTNSAGTNLSSNAISAGGTFYAKATITRSGVGVANQLVNFTTDSAVATLASSAALTDASGVARVQIIPVSVGSGSAAILTVAATVGSTAVTANTAFQTNAANVTLSNITTNPNSISALQSAAVSAAVAVNGTAASAGQVVVTFTAGCGSFSPVTATVASGGVANSVYFPTSTCSGNVSLSASAPGATTAANGSINVTAAQPANILFDSATPLTLVVSSAPTGDKQSVVRFKLVDSSGGVIASKSVTFTLDSQSLGAGVRFFAGAPTSTPQVVNTNGLGIAQVTIQSGTLPTPVIVSAALGDDPTMKASSSGLAVTSGKAAQLQSSVAAEKLAIEGFEIDGVQTSITMRVADRQGNPIPVGTQVIFVASHGLITGSCSVGATSACSVTYTSQGTRPANGRVSVLAYLDGEESFTDLNGNNIWDAGEPFFDMGTAFRDDNESGFSDPSEQTYPGGAIGTSACPISAYPSVTNTCDGTWSSTIRVRKPLVLAVSTQRANVTEVSHSSAQLVVKVADLNGNNMPTGTSVSAVLVSNTASANCSLTSVSPNVVINSANAANHTVFLNGDASCANAFVDITVTTPLNISTITRFSLN